MEAGGTHAVPGGDTECSHGWSAAQSVEKVAPHGPPPRGCVRASGRAGASLDLTSGSVRPLGNVLRPSGASRKGKISSTGSASGHVVAAPLHPWLQSVAPLGPKSA